MSAMSLVGTPLILARHFLHLADRLIQLSLSLERFVMRDHARGLFNSSFDLILFASDSHSPF
jgi:hypothetical protein